MAVVCRLTPCVRPALQADTLPHPHHLLPLLHALAPLAASAEPLLIGLASCRSDGLPLLCHPAGGAGYALTPPALRTLARFVSGGQLSAAWLDELDRLTYGGEDVAVALALKQSSGAVVVNVGGFHQRIRNRRSNPRQAIVMLSASCG
jgi:hypothetical protein